MGIATNEEMLNLGVQTERCEGNEKASKGKIMIFLLAKGFGRCWVWSFRKVTEFRRILKIYPPGNDHISPFKGHFEDVFPFPNVGYYVSSLEGKWWFHIFLNIFSAGGRFKSLQWINLTGEGATRSDLKRFWCGRVPTWSLKFWEYSRTDDIYIMIKLKLQYIP